MISEMIGRFLTFFFLMSMQGFSNPTSWFNRTPNEIRSGINALCMNLEAPMPQVGTISEKKLELEILRIYTPEGPGPFSLTLFIHGGAWVGGNLETHDNLARYLCKYGNTIVVSVDYTNAPEEKFPFQLEQCFDALLWATSNLANRETPIAVVGDSAGGNMAAALCLMARDRKGPKIHFQGLINPPLDLTCEGTLEPQSEEMDKLRWQAVQYLSKESEVYHPYVSPLLSDDLSCLPPALILVAEHDPVRFDGLAYAEKLKCQGNDATVYCQKNIGHLGPYGARASSEAQESLQVLAESLKQIHLNEQSMR